MDLQLIQERIRIPQGNFEFVREKTGEDAVWNCFLACESKFPIDYTDFAHKLRVAVEEIAVWLEVQFLKSGKRYKDRDKEYIKSEILNHIQNPNRMITIDGREYNYTYKSILLKNASKNIELFIPFLTHYGYDRSRNGLLNMKAYLWDLYAYGSANSHASIESSDSYQPEKMLHSFHDFLAVLFHVRHTFEDVMVPVEDYYPLPPSLLIEKGLYLKEQEQLYVRIRGNALVQGFYLGIKENRGTSLGDIRQNEAVNHLWNGYEDPANVARSSAELAGAEKDIYYRFYEFKTFPLSLTRSLIVGLNWKEREQIMKGMIRAVKSLHSCDIPVYHRHLSPEVFLLFPMKQGLKVVLYDFSYSKEESRQEEEADKQNNTMFLSISRMVERMLLDEFSPPEFSVPYMDKEEIAWDKVDVYALGQLLIYIASGYISESIEDGRTLLRNKPMTEEKKDILCRMIKNNPLNRPDIFEISEVFLQDR